MNHEDCKGMKNANFSCSRIFQFTVSFAFLPSLMFFISLHIHYSLSFLERKNLFSSHITAALFGECLKINNPRQTKQRGNILYIYIYIFSWSVFHLLFLPSLFFINSFIFKQKIKMMIINVCKYVSKWKKMIVVQHISNIFQFQNP